MLNFRALDMPSDGHQAFDDRGIYLYEAEWQHDFRHLFSENEVAFPISLVSPPSSRDHVSAFLSGCGRHHRGFASRRRGFLFSQGILESIRAIKLPSGHVVHSSCLSFRVRISESLFTLVRCRDFCSPPTLRLE